MKFGKQLENEAEDIPSEWRPYLIRYKALKKLIAKVALEIERRGLSATFLRECLKNNNLQDDSGPKIRYYFAGEPPNVHPCIQFIYDPGQSRIDELLNRVVASNSTQDSIVSDTKPKLHYRRTENDTDFFTLIRNADTAPVASFTADRGHPTSDAESVQSDDSDSSSIEQRRRSDAALLFRELMDSTLPKDRITELTTDGELEIVSSPPDQEKKGENDSNDRDENDYSSLTPKKAMRSLVIELERDDEFFTALMKELDQAALLQDINSQQFEHDVNELERRMAKTASPSHISDMYAWRAIFNLYMDAQVFRGKVEKDRSIRSVQKSKDQMEWFTEQLKTQNILSQLKSKASKDTFEQFIALNTELITMKHYQLLNQTAVTKILKKHDKRSGLTASSSFPMVIQNSHFFNVKLADILCASLLNRLITIIPQPDDYLCPVCMMVAWRPIRLVCGHVFCVRCLLKAQRKKMANCPLCRHKNAVFVASSNNLDMPMQNFLKQYFPREIKQKKRDAEREQAMEDVQVMTGRKYTEEQLMRMSQHDQQCHIM
ncbi:SPX domain-containing protein [Zychaea mexicana]|uniref:SPX domain-containing protein n=1 Tax=Zychaea mexicana TaxID=64656 RepID=UPI0022FE76D3|nr:SPX domain-containing protein [Zychaea mexicana]KAI9493247.1 SPX domain-containing protein [Zychaea mexicana]